MVHALEQAHRVLVPGGVLVDLRPAASHRRAGIGLGRSWRRVGTLRESLEEDRAADAAVASVIRRGLFRPHRRVRFDLDRVMDTLDDFRLWLEDFSRVEKYGMHDWLIQRLDRALARVRRKPKLTVRGLMTLGVLEKL